MLTVSASRAQHRRVARAGDRRPSRAARSSLPAFDVARARDRGDERVDLAAPPSRRRSPRTRHVEARWPSRAADAMSPEPAIASELGASTPRAMSPEPRCAALDACAFTRRAPCACRVSFERVRILSAPVLDHGLDVGERVRRRPRAPALSASPCDHARRSTGADRPIAGEAAPRRASRGGRRPAASAAARHEARASRAAAKRASGHGVSSGGRCRLDARARLGGFAAAPMPRSRADRERHLERALGRGLAHGHVAHLAPGTRLALAVEVQVRAGMRAAPPPSAARPRARCRPAGSPSPRACAARGRPAAGRRARAPAARTARCGRRRWCSGRCCAGAARSRSAAAGRRPRTSRPRARPRSRAPRRGAWRARSPRAASAAGMRAGAMVRSRMPCAWRFSATGKHRDRAVVAAREHHRDLALEGEQLLEHARHALPFVRSGARGRRATRCAPGPCRRSRGARS